VPPCADHLQCSRLRLRPCGAKTRCCAGGCPTCIWLQRCRRRRLLQASLPPSQTKSLSLVLASPVVWGSPGLQLGRCRKAPPRRGLPGSELRSAARGQPSAASVRAAAGGFPTPTVQAVLTEAMPLPQSPSKRRQSR
ncbi:unnamed protein product, partial [Polarella glacialis]